MSSESGQRLSMEELKRRNAPQTMVPQDCSSKEKWRELLYRLDELEASVAAQEALFRALSRQAGQLPTQAQLEALARDVAQIQATLKPAGKKSERWFSLSRVRLPKLRLPDIPWSSLLLGLTALLLTGGVLWTAWFSWGKLWSVMQALIP